MPEPFFQPDHSSGPPSALEAAQSAQAAAEGVANTLTISERQYRRLFEAARDGILLLDSDRGRITDANPFMTELLGYTHDELLGKELWEIGLLQDKAASQKETVIEYVKSADRHQYGNQAFVNELVTWLRFNKPEALHRLDGLYTACTGNPQIPRWLGQRFITTASAGRQSDTDVNNVRSSSGLIVIAAAQDDKRHWIETGRLYERLALTLTALHIKTAFLNQPVEVADVRSQFQSYLHLGTAQPQLLLRFGYAPLMPRSLRRPVEQVLVSSHPQGRKS